MSHHNQQHVREERELDSKLAETSNGYALPDTRGGPSMLSNQQDALPLPSQVLLSNHRTHGVAPARLFTETTPSPEVYNAGSGESYYPAQTTPQPDFAKRANALINAQLGRTPDGMSVIDPDSILDESGRLYHGYKDGKYLLPNDAAEQDRLDLQHHVFKLVLDGWLALAPMESVPEYVLDVATGTGIWAFEFAEQNPQSYVIGTDLSAIQPERDVSNCVFQKDDAEAEWVFRAPGQPNGVLFDYVHMRLVCSCFDDTQQVMRQAFDNMKPGGWIELQDAAYDTTVKTPLIRWYEGMNKGLATIGRDITRPKKYKQWLEEVGFTDVQERCCMVPCSPWPKDKRLKEIGLYQLQNLLEGIRPMAWKMFKLAGFTEQEIEDMVSAAKDYLRDIRNQPTAYILVVYGRKPLDADSTAETYPVPAS